MSKCKRKRMGVEEEEEEVEERRRVEILYSVLVEPGQPRCLVVGLGRYQDE